MIELQTKTVRQGINKAYLKINVKRTDIDAFKAEAIAYLNSLDQADGESEEHLKGYLKDFLQLTFYSKVEKLVNTSDRIDLAIYSGKSKSTSVDVIIEAKRPENKAEMISKEKLNQKAFQEALHYYFDERLRGNDSIKHVVITNYTEFFIFDAQEIERLFYSKKKLVKAYKEWSNDEKVSGKTEFIYYTFSEFINTADGILTGIYADLNSYKKQLHAEADEESDRKLIPLYKLFSPEHLTKKSFANDSNSLDKGFYNELLHILGLQEVKEGSKRLIQRLPEEERNSGSLVENTIATLKYDQHMNEVRDAKVQYGESEDDQLFGVALELVITWVNRVLFLKLLEAQLLAYHQFDAKFKFLKFDGIIDEYDELNKLFFRVLALKNDERPESLQKRFGHIPYLNSSLFDSTNLEKATIQISGLDDKATLPVYNRSVFKKSANPPKGSLNTLEYLLRFLDAYNFSAESSGGIQTEDKALINASVLGLIFEKINGYKDGSFFTPGFITEYMARETLRKSVVDKLNEAFNWECKEFSELHRKVESKSLEEVNTVINSITICDPAVGSGHFLVSCLNELLAIKADLKVLCDVEGKRIPYLDIEVENDELAVEHNGELFEYKVNHEWKSERVVRTHAGKERQRIQEALFHEKRFLIEHCLFGVDINPNSVKICRLRLWIELLKHAYYKENYSPIHRHPELVSGSSEEATNAVQSTDKANASGKEYAPYSELEVLPNIDINIKQGNSLVSRFGLDEDLTSIFKKSEHSLEDYKQAVKNYRETRDRAEKHRLQKLIDDIKAEYSETLLNNKPINKKLSKERGKLELMQNEDLFGGGKATKKALTAQQKKVSKLEAQKAEEEAGAFYREAFEWRFEFPEVLDDQGNYSGFDVVIGNPPWGAKLDDASSQYLKQINREIIVRMTDTFMYFVNLSFSLIHKSSFVSMILPDVILYQTDNRKLRQKILELMYLEVTINLGDNIFTDVARPSCIMILSNNESNFSSNGEFSNRDSHNLYNTELSKFETSKITSLPNNIIPTKNLDGYGILSKIGKRTLIDLIDDDGIQRGVSPDYKKAFIVNEQTIKEKKLEAEYLFPTITGGRDLDKFIVINPNQKVIYTSKSDTSQEFSNIVNYIKEFADEITCKEVKQGKHPIWALHRSRRREIFEKTKLLGVITSDNIQVSLDTLNTYPTDGIYLFSSNSKVKNLFLLGFLNSKVITYLYRLLSMESGRTLSQIKPKLLEKLPIPQKLDSKLVSKVEILCSKIIESKKENPEADTSKLEAEIDQMVYELYGLTEEEIAIVEESVN